MRRRDLLTLTGLSAPVFNVMMKRDLIPFRSGGRAGRNAYSADDACKLALALALAAEGAKQASAAGLVRDAYDALLARASGLRTRESGDVFFGRVSTLLLPEEGVPGAGLSVPVYGTAAHVAAALALRRFGSARVTGLMVVNVSDCVRDLVERAEEADVLSARLDELARLLRAV
jgi:hypothetical protein